MDNRTAFLNTIAQALGRRCVSNRKQMPRRLTTMPTSA